MKLIDGLKLIGRPAEIPDCSRNELPGLFKHMGHRVGVEVGVFKGKFTRLFCETGLKIYGVDPWLTYDDYRVKFARHRNTQERQNFLYEHTQRYLAQYIARGQCQLVRKTSMEAVRDFEDNSLDFVYIDGNHGLKYVTEDIWEWSKKVRSGGIVSGHDYIVTGGDPLDPDVFQVKLAVDAYTQAANITNWYILGGGDRAKSWLWIKR